MIFDFCGNIASYSKNNKKVWNAAFDFIAAVTPDMEDGKYHLQGDNLFGIVQSYDTKPLAEGKMEIHRRYIDIQTIIVGTERIFYSPVGMLDELTPYSEENDCALFRFMPDVAAEFRLSPGKFLMFFPEEGHMPCICKADGVSGKVKKVVMKIDKKLLVR